MFWILSSGSSLGGESDRIFEEFTELYAKINPVTTKPFEEFVHPPTWAFAEYNEFALMNWKLLLSEVNRLPFREGNPVEVTAGQISEICEALPPAEYLDLLDAMLVLVEQDKLPSDLLHLRLMGTEEKNHFIAVNFEHPRVQSLIKKAKLVCSDDLKFTDDLNGYLSGSRADLYQVTNGSNFFPETLPGVKLRHPDEKLIGRYERMTRKKIPRDNKLETRSVEQIDRRGETSEKSFFQKALSHRTEWIVGLAALSSLLCIIVAKFYWKRSHA